MLELKRRYLWRRQLWRYRAICLLMWFEDRVSDLTVALLYPLAFVR